MAGPLVVTAVIPLLILWLGGAAFPTSIGLLQLVGFLGLAFGLGMACWCMWAFIFVGRGMPTSVDPPRALVSAGLYRVTRNPMYCALLLMIFGEALFFGSGWLALHLAVTWLGLHLFVTWYEEPAMRRRFGDDYNRYCRSVPRWFWPLR